MWFKRRKKTEQDHALSESLRSLQSLLSENGRREPTLEPRAGETGIEEDRMEPTSTPTLRDRTERDEPGGSETPPSGSGSRWRDLNLSFDAEPVAPRSRRDSEPETTEDTPAPQADEHASVESELAEAATTAAPTPDAEPADAPEDQTPGGELLQGGPSPRPTAEHAAPVAEPEPDHEAPAGSPPADTPAAAEARQAAGEPASKDREAEVAVVYYDDFRVPAPEGEDEDEADELALGGDEPDLEIDLAEAGTPDVAEPVEPAEAETMAPATEPEPGTEPEPEPPQEAAVRTVEPPPPADEAAAHEQAPAAEAPAVERGEDQLDLELGLEDVSEDDIPTLTDVVYVPEGKPADAAASPVTEAPAGEPDTGEPDAPEVPRFPDAVETPDDASLTSDAAPEPPAVDRDETAGHMPPPERGPSPHDDKAERCIENLRVRLQLMDFPALSPEQEKELHDTLVDFLDDIGLED